MGQMPFFPGSRSLERPVFVLVRRTWGWFGSWLREDRTWVNR